MRISDADRAEVSNALCRHFGDGRLDEDELAERLAKTAAAKTRADLAPLLADLPRLDPPADGAGSKRGGRSGVLLVLVALIVLAWGAAGVAVGYVPLRVPWLLVALVVFLVVRRGRWRHPQRWY